MSQTLNLQIKSVLDVLHQELRLMTPEELEKILKFDIVNNHELRSNLEASPKLIEKDGRWRWKSEFYIRNKEELLAFLRRRHDGVYRHALDDTYKGAVDDIKTILEEKPREVIMLKNSTDKKEMLYPYESELGIEVSKDIKEMFEKIRAPDRPDLDRYLFEHNLKSGKAEDLKERAIKRKRPEKVRKARRTKMTNVHLEGTAIDLNEEGTNKSTAFN